MKSVEGNQPLTSRVEESSQFSLYTKTDKGQRKIIFMIKCTLGNEAISIIMDGGNCENMVSDELVKKAR